LDKNGELSEKYNSRESLLKMYNSNRTITLDKYRNKSVLYEEAPVTTVAENQAEPLVTDTAPPDNNEDISE
jgi:hypothetical protein